MSSANADLSKQIQTVRGAIPAADLGVTLSHEHCLIDLTCTLTDPETEAEKERMGAPLSIKNVGYFRYHPLDNRDNLTLLDENLAISELMHFRNAGGTSVVDATNVEICRDPPALVRISEATGLNIIMGSGHYVKASMQVDEMASRTEEDIAEEIVSEVRYGVDGTGIRAGLIGEIGCSWPLEDLEIKVLRAAGMAQKETGAPLMIHPGRDETAPMEVVEILAGAGADLSHTVISHIGRTLFNPDSRYRLADRGCFLAYDLWGNEGHYPASFSVIDVLNDTQRVAQIKDLIQKGYGDRLLISHDICWKFRYMAYGGHGYAHILQNGVPLMRNREMTSEEVDRLLVENPKHFYAFW
jgi:phosphotriesterase-related protein